MNILNLTNEILSIRNGNSNFLPHDFEHSLVDFFILANEVNSNCYEIGTDNFKVNMFIDEFLLRLHNNIKSYMTSVDPDDQKAYYLQIAALNLWSYYKAVYKIDNDFFECLTRTKDLKISPLDIIRIPKNVFYLDLEAIEVLKPKFSKKSEKFLENYSSDLNESMKHPFAGAIVAVSQVKDGIMIGILPLRGDGFHADSVVLDIKYSDCEFKNGVLFYDYDFDKSLHLYDDKRHNNSVNIIVMFVLQFLTYMTCEKPDIRMSKGYLNKKKRFERLKKPYDGVRDYEVGIRFGKSISILNDKYKEKELNYTDDITVSEYVKCPPRPHLVSAHWHGYWVGEGRKEWAYRWIMPYTTGGEKIDCVIQDCVEIEKSPYSHGEQLLYSYLELLDIDFHPQYRVSEINKIYDCICKINGVDCFIEFDGEQHFKQVNNWDFEKTKKSDTIKNNYCREHGIPLLRIKYTQFSKIYDMLLDLKQNIDYYKSHYNTYMSDKEYYNELKESLVDKWML